MCVWFFFYPTPCVIYFIFLVEFINWFNLYQRNVIINIKKRVLDRTYTVQQQQQPPKRQGKKIPKRQRQESIIFRRCYYWWWYVRKNLYSEITFDHSRLIFLGVCDCHWMTLWPMLKSIDCHFIRYSVLPWMCFNTELQIMHVLLMLKTFLDDGNNFYLICVTIVLPF